MKRIMTVASICLLTTCLGVSSSLAMGQAKKAEKPVCTKCPEGKCVCEAKTCCGDDASKCCASKAAEAKLPCGCKAGECKCPKK